MRYSGPTPYRLTHTVPPTVGLAGAAAASLATGTVPAIVLAYFVAAAAAAEALVIVFGSAVAARMRQLAQRPDRTVQRLALTARMQHEFFRWYVKLAVASVLGWAVLAVMR